MTKHSIAKLGILMTGIVATSPASLAATSGKESKAVIEKCKESCITGVCFEPSGLNGKINGAP